MAPKTRKILFLIFLSLFLAIAPLAVFYSQGYRFNLNPPEGGKIITQTGGLFLNAIPKQVEVYVDNKLIKKTDFFFGSALIENLLPKFYRIEAKKDGYFSWVKNLEVREKEVTEVKDIVLIPENPDFNILTKETEDFWFSPDFKKIILKENDGANWSLKLYDTEKNIKSHLIGEADVYQRNADLLNVAFFEDSKGIYLDVGMKEQEKRFSLNLEKVPPLLMEETLSEKIPLQNIIVYQEQDDAIYYLDNLGYLFKTDSSFGPKTKINENPFPVKKETEYKIYAFSDFVFLREDKALYLFSSESKSFEIFFEGLNSLKVSPDDRKLVYFSDSEIWVLFLGEKYDEATKKSGDREFLIRLSDKIGDCFWLNSDYLVFNSGNIIKIAEIDNRDKLNVTDLVNFKDPKIFWDPVDKKIYILSDGNLSVSDRLF